jgi:sporulation protein YlmC with PRC-barrel domain
MPMLKRARLLGVATLFASVSTIALAQTTQPPTTPPEPKSPPATTPVPAPAPQTDPARKPMERPTAPDKSAATKAHPLIGLNVLSSDGNKVGTVQKVEAEADGKVKAIHIKSGGFLGLGGKIVAIPESKFSRAGINVQLRMTADEVSKLAEVQEQG